MNKLAHLLLGAAAGLEVTHLLRYEMVGVIIGTVVAAMMATVADTDQMWGIPELKPFQRACRPMISPFEHRGILHAPITAIVAGWVIAQMTSVPGIGLMVSLGWMTHILSDGLSKMGVPLLFPLSWKRFKIGPLPIHSGNPLEVPFSLAVLVGVMVIAIGH